MIQTPEIIEVEAQVAAVIHLDIPRDQMQIEMPKAIKELMGLLSDQGQAPQGPMFAHHLKFSETHFDFEVGFPVTQTIRSVGRVRNGSLPAATVARTTYAGPYEGLFGAWDAFGKWLGEAEILKQHGLKRGDSIWEIYTLGPETSENPAD